MEQNLVLEVGGGGITQDKKYAVIDKSGQNGYLTDKRQDKKENNIDIEYIQSTGTQYIDTGVYANINTKIELEAMSTDSRSSNIWAQITGAGASYHHSSAIQAAYNPSSSWLAIDYGTDAVEGMTISNNNKFSIIISNNNHYINNSKRSQYGTYSGICDYSIWIFDENYGNGSTQKFIGRVYSYKIYDNNNVIKDFIPVYNEITNSAGLYDKVGGRFYPNNGTGAFTTGTII